MLVASVTSYMNEFLQPISRFVFYLGAAPFQTVKIIRPMAKTKSLSKEPDVRANTS